MDQVINLLMPLALQYHDAPGQFYNPLFLYGSTGFKTHLLHAVGNKVIKSNQTQLSPT